MFARYEWEKQASKRWKYVQMYCTDKMLLLLCLFQENTAAGAMEGFSTHF